jgi:hypothetical protein
VDLLYSCMIDCLAIRMMPETDLLRYRDPSNFKNNRDRAVRTMGYVRCMHPSRAVLRSITQSFVLCLGTFVFKRQRKLLGIIG